MRNTELEELDRRLKSVLVPERAGRCCDCNNRYYGHSMDVVRMERKWRCLSCARKRHPDWSVVNERTELLRLCALQDEAWRAERNALRNRDVVQNLAERL